MELFSKQFKQAVQAALDSSKVVLAVMHAKAKDPLIEQTKQSPDVELFTVTVGNRDGLPDMITKRILSGSRE
jgi:nucleoside-triphosphatase THEP1